MVGFTGPLLETMRIRMHTKNTRFFFSFSETAGKKNQRKQTNKRSCLFSLFLYFPFFITFSTTPRNLHIA